MKLLRPSSFLVNIATASRKNTSRRQEQELAEQ